MKRVLCATLLLVMLVSLLASCGSGEGKDNVTTPNASDTTVPAVDTTTQYVELPNLPEDAFYDGYEFVVLVTGNFVNNDFASEGIGTDVVSDAIYRKNTAIEDKYGITITNIDQIAFGSSGGSGTGYTRMNQSYTAGTFDYSMAMIGTYDVCSLASGGMLTDLNKLPYIDMDRSWWDQEAKNDLTVSGTLFYTTGDISLTDNIITNCIMFNKMLVNSMDDLNDPYEMVKNDNWTYETFGAEVKKVSEDVDGNTMMDKNDRYGLLTWGDAVLAALSSGGGRICTINADGEIELTLNSERSLAVIEQYCDITFSDSSFNYQYQNTVSSSWDPIRIAMFDEDRAVYYMTTFNTVPKHRDKETDFGILPFPKLDAQQEKYGHLVSAYHCQFLCVPFYVEDEERTGAIIEDLAYTSKQILTPAYYERTLVGNVFRDDESTEMLDIIFASRVFDIGIYYKIGGYKDNLMNIVNQRNTGLFSSTYATYERIAEKQLSQINAKFTELLDE